MKTNAPLFIILTVLMAFTSSCTKNTDCKVNNASECRELPDRTNIRIRNSTRYTLCNLMISPSGTLANYGLMEQNEVSCYNNFETAYSYAYVSFEINGEQYILQPIDYIGAAPLGKGNFTYTISNIDVANKSFELKATKD